MRIICTRPNAGGTISGIEFEAHPDGVISVDDVPEDIAKIMLSMTGYKAVDGDSQSAYAADAEENTGGVPSGVGEEPPVVAPAPVVEAAPVDEKPAAPVVEAAKPTGKKKQEHDK